MCPTTLQLGNVLFVLYSLHICNVTKARKTKEKKYIKTEGGSRDKRENEMETKKNIKMERIVLEKNMKGVEKFKVGAKL